MDHKRVHCYTKEKLDNRFEHRVVVRQGCLLSPVLFKLYLANGTISINGREISNLQIAYQIDLIAGTEEELQELTTTERRGMEISGDKSKIMINSRIAPITTKLMNGESLEKVT